MLPLAIDFDSEFENGEIKRGNNDTHLSKFGHKFLAKELAQLVGEVR